MMLASCNADKADAATNTDEQKVEAIVEEATIEDVVEPCDTTAAVTRGANAGEGFGRCLASSCNCKSFEGRGQTCRNCGHAYKKHY